jgi:crotonobetainyl-CoA:carnitine CoA-transferase CaiB-like acyl-CoA transferase
LDCRHDRGKNFPTRKNYFHKKLEQEKKGYTMSRPFEGIRVIDITHVLAGPHATYQLALLGADVIKVERPGDPDQSREQGPDKEANKQWMGTGFLGQGSNKRCVSLDLKMPQGQEILKRLVKDADVLVENYRSGALRALGLGFEDLTKIKPDLIYCSLTAWGQDGPRGSQTAYDQVIQGYSGIMSITGTNDSGPVRCGPQLLDFGMGITAAFAIASALFHRERTGEGQFRQGTRFADH